jgi:hypothetical protein
MTKRIKNWKATADVPGNDTRNKRRATTMDARRVAPLPVWQFAGATETIGMSNSIFSNNRPWRYKVPEIYYDFEVEIELTKLRQDETLELVA